MSQDPGCSSLWWPKFTRPVKHSIVNECIFKLCKSHHFIESQERRITSIRVEGVISFKLPHPVKCWSVMIFISWKLPFMWTVDSLIRTCTALHLQPGEEDDSQLVPQPLHQRPSPNFTISQTSCYLPLAHGCASILDRPPSSNKPFRSSGISSEEMVALTEHPVVDVVLLVEDTALGSTCIQVLSTSFDLASDIINGEL